LLLRGGNRHRLAPSAAVLFSFVYLGLRRLLELIISLRTVDAEKVWVPRIPSTGSAQVIVVTQALNLRSLPRGCRVDPGQGISGTFHWTTPTNL
jgi:hypothetical protein